MEVEGAGLADEVHGGFSGKLVALTAIAGMAAGDEILPGGRSAARTRHYVVQRELARGKDF